MAEWSLCFVFFISAQSKEAAYFWYRLSMLGFSSFEVLVLIFFFAITKTKPSLLRKITTAVVCIPMLLQFATIGSNTAFLTDLYLTKGGWIEVFASSSFIYISYIVDVAFCTILSLILSYRWMKFTKIPNEKIQARMILIAGIIAFILGSINNIVMPLVHSDLVPSLAHVTILVFIYVIGHSINKYKLMNISTGIAANEIISYIRDLVILTDHTGEIIKINKNTENVLGYSENEIVGKNFIDIIEKNEAMRDFSEKFVINNYKSIVTELNLKNNTEGNTPVKLSISKINDRFGQFLGMVVVANDITLTKQLEFEAAERALIADSLKSSNQKLTEIDRLKSEFISTVSHELRTPLTSVLGFAKIVRKKFEDIIIPSLPLEDKKLERTVNQLKENMNIIVSEGERLTKLINDVLDIEKMEAGDLSLNFEELNINDIIDQSIASVSSLVNQKGLKIVIERKNSIQMVQGDRDRIIQIVINLLSNAIKFTDEGAVICSTYLDNDYIVISIKDEGIGISEDNLPKVFEKFKQVGDTMTDKPKGTGLGLPICKQIVEMHNGEIWAESEFGKGSTFSFKLPIFNKEALGDQIQKSSNSTHFENQNTLNRTNVDSIKSFVRKEILIADDEEPIRKLLKQALEENNFFVREASDGFEAISIARKHIPDIVIMDIKMPVINGFDAAAIIKKAQETSHVPIIMLSVIEEKNRGYESGADYYLVKPVDIDELMKLLNKITMEVNS